MNEPTVLRRVFRISQVIYRRDQSCTPHIKGNTQITDTCQRPSSRLYALRSQSNVHCAVHFYCKHLNNLLRTFLIPARCSEASVKLKSIKGATRSGYEIQLTRSTTMELKSATHSQRFRNPNMCTSDHERDQKPWVVHGTHS